MRGRASSAVLVLVACAHHPFEGESHPCDPQGAEVAPWMSLPSVETELFPDEIALRGRCPEEPNDQQTRQSRSLHERVQALRQQVFEQRECVGTCDAMHASLPKIGPEHDLEDETLQRECSAAITSLDGASRAGCRHVCLVERRRLAAKALFARVMAGLEAFDDSADVIADGGTGFDRDNATVRRMWQEKKLELPPRRIQLATHASPYVMTAEGSLYPGGPPLKLGLIYGDAGCGHSQWTVLSW